MSASKTSLRKQLAEIEKRLSSKGGAPVTEAEGRRRRVVAQAALMELRLRVRKGELVERSRADEAVARISQTVRDSLLSLPERVSGQVAALTDPRQVCDLLKGEIRQTLSHLSEDIRSAGQQQPVVT